MLWLKKTKTTTDKKFRRRWSAPCECWKILLHDGCPRGARSRMAKPVWMMSITLVICAGFFIWIYKNHISILPWKLQWQQQGTTITQLPPYLCRSKGRCAHAIKNSECTSVFCFPQNVIKLSFSRRGPQGGGFKENLADKFQESHFQ